MIPIAIEGCGRMLDFYDRYQNKKAAAKCSGFLKY